ncbi:MAG: DUF507 family protein [Deltaproteobacteria bacterium]|nr:DUF507 family protein [Deltaproteobacteria bacterium]NIS76181.1 DUF507 family protein [Deltaproteobacteria bacterium]
MRLNEQEMKGLADFIYERLMKREMITLKSEESEVRRRIYEAIEKDIRAEQALDEEVEKIIDEHIQRAGEDINRRKLFKMIKHKLARERGLVL